MSTRVTQSVDRPVETSDEPIRTTRIDARHVAANESTAGETDKNMAARADAVLASDDVHTVAGAAALAQMAGDQRTEVDAHARQLGLELAARQAALDAREEELNRRLAEFDHEMRRARLSLDSKRCELEEREVELGGKRADLEARFERIVAGENELQAERRERLEKQFATPSTERVETTADRENDAVPVAAFVSLEFPSDYRTRVEHLEKAEYLLASEASALAEARRQFETEKAAANKERLAEQSEAAHLHARRGAVLDRREQELKARCDQLDAKARSLDDVRRELIAGQRETLEMRVAVQELWLSLSGRVAPATMLQSLAESRSKLAAQYRESGGEFEAAERRLREAGARLAEQIAGLKEQRQSFHTWAEERQAAIERQAARLVAREQELEAQDAQYRRQERLWEEQRAGYRREIRRLLAAQRAEPHVDNRVP
jgi:chromosome segregation ATPase